MAIRLLVLMIGALRFSRRDASGRSVAAAPGLLRVIIDADAPTKWTTSSPSRWRLACGSFPDRRIRAAHYGDAAELPASRARTPRLERVLAKAGMSGRYPIKRGADPIVYRDRPAQSEGVDFIIERALAATPEAPLWLVLLGPATDAAAALLKEPR